MKKKKLALRLVQILVVLVGISFVTFLLTYLSPGDPVRNMYTAAGIMPTEELVAETREELGLNDPLPTQYLRWLRNCLRGDFGRSYTLNKPVTELLLGRLWPTVKLTLLSMGLMLLLAVPLGMLSAVYKDRWIDYLVRGLTFVGCAMPNFWVGLLLMLAFCVHVKAFPVISSAGDLRSIFLPALTLALAMSSKYTRQVRTAPREAVLPAWSLRQGCQDQGERVIPTEIKREGFVPLFLYFQEKFENFPALGGIIKRNSK